MSCELCAEMGGLPLWQDDFCRVVLVDDAHYPGYCRVILNRHVQEMSDLDVAGRERLMRVVVAVEAALREVARPDKINLASLGNRVPHLHWHVIPRYRQDRNFPNAIWGEALRDGAAPEVDMERLRLAVVRQLG